MNRERKHLLPIDVDWTMELVDEISSFLMAERKNIQDITASLTAIKIIAIVDKHLKENKYELKNDL